jgi:hypothetical protein
VVLDSVSLLARKPVNTSRVDFGQVRLGTTTCISLCSYLRSMVAGDLHSLRIFHVSSSCWVRSGRSLVSRAGVRLSAVPSNDVGDGGALDAVI